MARIDVDHASCQGHALCHAVDPDVFPLDELGYSAIERGVAQCPERAITYTE